jgi:hypothetical protein
MAKQLTDGGELDPGLESQPQTPDTQPARRERQTLAEGTGDDLSATRARSAGLTADRSLATWSAANSMSRSFYWKRSRASSSAKESDLLARPRRERRS